MAWASDVLYCLYVMILKVIKSFQRSFMTALSNAVLIKTVKLHTFIIIIIRAMVLMT